MTHTVNRRVRKGLTKQTVCTVIFFPPLSLICLPVSQAVQCSGFENHERVRQACFAYCRSPALTCSKSLPSGGMSEGINGRAGASQEFPIVAAQPCTIFSSRRVRKERAGGVVLVEGGLCAVCVSAEGGVGGGYTVVLFPSALILLS